MTLQHRYSLPWLVCLMFAASCNIVDPPVVSPGIAVISLIAAPGAPGAFLLELSGGSTITSVATANGAYQLRSSRLNGATVQVFLRGNLSVGAVLRVGVSDKSRLPQVRVLEAVSTRAAGYTIQNPQNYTLQSVAAGSE